jgi:hypothetical protein
MAMRSVCGHPGSWRASCLDRFRCHANPGSQGSDPAAQGHIWHLDATDGTLGPRARRQRGDRQLGQRESARNGPAAPFPALLLPGAPPGALPARWRSLLAGPAGQPGEGEPAREARRRP